VLLVAHIVNSSLMVLIPLGVAVWLIRRWRLDWAIFGFGALTFIISQILHIPFNQFLLNPLLRSMGETDAAWVGISVLLGLSAGVFEETARYVVLRRWLARVRVWNKGVFYGLGHGGIEAIILGGLSFFALFQALALRGVALETIVPPEQLEAARVQLASYWGMAWYEPLWATLERVSAMSFHVMAALLVLVAVRFHRPVWLAAAIAAHTLFNAVALVGIRYLGVEWTELLLAALAAGCVWVAIRLRPLLSSDRGQPVDGHGPVDVASDKIRRTEIESERIDDSRYV
jgi:uncharacterized membrane protein YhfC